MSIFEKKDPDAVLPLPQYVTTSYQIGCFSALNGFTQYQMTGVLSIERCQVVCKGFRFYGLTMQNTVPICDCYKQVGISQLAQSSCSIRCGDAGNQFCGGPNADSIYSSFAACSNTDQQLDTSKQLILKNPSFESGTAYWTATGSSNQITWASRADATAAQGSKLARIDSKAAGLSMTLTQPVKLCQGLPYEISYSAKQDVNAGCTMTLVLAPFGQLPTTTGGLTWNGNYVQFYAPGESVDLVLNVKCDGVGKGGFRKLYLDNFKLNRFAV
jgi:hypothetical protein